MKRIKEGEQNGLKMIKKGSFENEKVVCFILFLQRFYLFYHLLDQHNQSVKSVK